MNKKAIWIVAALVIILIALVLVNGSSNHSGPNAPIRIGVMSILSGDEAAWGVNAKKGIDMAVDEYNAAHPDRPVVTTYADTKADSKNSVTGFTKLTSIDKVQYVIGPLFLNESVAIDPLVQQAGIPVISPSYAPLEDRKNPKNPLLMWMDAMTETDRIADYVVSQGIKSVSIIDTTDAWESAVGNEFAKRVSAAGVKVLDVETVQTNANDVRFPTSKLLAGKPDAVFMATYFQYIHAAKALGEQQYKGKLFSIEIDDYLAGETKTFVPEVFVVNPENYSTGFDAAFQKKYGTRPGLPAGHAYDAATLLLSDIAKGMDQAAVLQDFKTRTEYDGVSGKIIFTPDGKTIFPTALYSIKNGVITRISALQ